jgi:hypothetical protein
LRRIYAVICPEEAHAQANTKILDKRWKSSHTGVARGVPESDKRAAGERKLNLVDRNYVIALHKEKAITTKGQQIYRRKSGRAAEISEPLNRCNA